MLSALAIISILSYGLINLSALPKILKVRKEKSTKGVSIFGNFMVWVGCLIIFIYFISVNEPVGMFGGVLNTIFSGVVWIYQGWYRWRIEAHDTD
jgi:uncharacterized protein with PQ loop repeat